MSDEQDEIVWNRLAEVACGQHDLKTFEVWVRTDDGLSRVIGPEWFAQFQALDYSKPDIHRAVANLILRVLAAQGRELVPPGSTRRCTSECQSTGDAGERAAARPSGDVGGCVQVLLFWAVAMVLGYQIQATRRGPQLFTALVVGAIVVATLSGVSHLISRVVHGRSSGVIELIAVLAVSRSGIPLSHALRWSL